MIKKRTRKELYDKFRQGAIPSGADFADFIRSQINLIDDGLDISDDPENPINIRAKGDEENLLDFSDPINRKRWRISNRSVDLSREGFNIKADDKTNLFIDRDYGRVGIDTDLPEAKLHIKQINDNDAIRIDDEGNDSSPFVINSDGNVGIGIGGSANSPEALLHVNNTRPVDTLKVENRQSTNDAFLVMNSSGDTSVGFDQPNPNAKLAVNGAVTIGSNTENPGPDGLYVKGDVIVDGNLVFDPHSTGGSIEIKGDLSATGQDVIITDNVQITAGSPAGSDGNLSVAGDSTLGTYKGDLSDNRVIINGHIITGRDSDPTSTGYQKELLVNDVLSVNRETNKELVKVLADFEVLKKSTLGNNTPDDYIYLNGTVQREGTSPVHIQDDLNVTGDSSVQDAEVRNRLQVLGDTDLQTLGLRHGQTIEEFSSDSALQGNSNSAVPTERAVKEYIDNLMAGSIAPFAMPTPPAGWLLCDGRAVSRSEYSRLFGLITTIYGHGNGNSTFNLPDLRNYFIRGWHPGQSRKLGSPQAHGMAAHIHTFHGTQKNVNSSGHSHVDEVSGSRRIRRGYRGHRTHARHINGARTSWESHEHSYTPQGSLGYNHGYANETRPVNIVLMYCIKF